LKVLFISNILPNPQNPTNSSFITSRMKTLKSFGILFDIYGFVPKDTFLVKVLKNLLRKKTIFNFFDSSYEVNGINYKYEKFNHTLIDVFNSKVLNRKHSNIKYCEELENKLFDKVKDERFDLVHTHALGNLPGALMGKLLSEKLGIPHIVTCHMGDIKLEIPSLKEIYIDVLENAAKVIFVSNALLNKAKFYGYSDKNSVVIPNGFEPDIFKPLDKEKIKKDLRLDKKIVGFVGRLTRVKRADKLPEIFSYISSMYDAEFLVVGDGELREDIERECKKRRLKVKFVGVVPHEKLAYYMNAMDVMILPSRKESFGTVIIESQGCGVAVVGSSNGGIPEAIGDGGIVVEEGENFEKRFAQSVVKLLENPIDGSYLRKRAMGFPWENIVEKEIEVYNEVLNQFGGSNA